MEHKFRQTAVTLMVKPSGGERQRVMGSAGATARFLRRAVLLRPGVHRRSNQSTRIWVARLRTPIAKLTMPISAPNGEKQQCL